MAGRDATTILSVLSVAFVLSVPSAGSPPLVPATFPPLPDPIGYAGPFVGVHNGALIVAGGANFPEVPPWQGGKKVWHDRIHVMTRDGAGKWGWQTAARTLPCPLAYGVSVSTARGVLCVGGCDNGKSYADVFLLKWNRESGQIERETLPPLPSTISFSGGAVLNGTVYVVGGRTAEGESSGTWALTLGEDAWRELPPLPATGRLMPTVVAQSGRLYLFSGRTGGPLHKLRVFTDAWAYDPEAETWSARRNIHGKGRNGEDGVAAAATPAVAYGKSRILLFGGGGSHRCSLHKRIANAKKAELLRAAGDAAGAEALETANRDLMATDAGHALEILCYDTAQDTWEVLGTLPPGHSVVATRAEQLGATIVIPTGETRPGVRTRRIIGFAQVSNN
jgi:solute:Na+ symporter, SSS family